MLLDLDDKLLEQEDEVRRVLVMSSNRATGKDRGRRRRERQWQVHC